MFYLKKNVLALLILSIICTSIIHAMKKHSIDSHVIDIDHVAEENLIKIDGVYYENGDYESNDKLWQCYSGIMNSFRMDLDLEVTKYVTKAIIDFDISRSSTMRDDAQQYYKSLFSHLISDNILRPNDFCDESIPVLSKSRTQLLEACYRRLAFYEQKRDMNESDQDERIFKSLTEIGEENIDMNESDQDEKIFQSLTEIDEENIDKRQRLKDIKDNILRNALYFCRQCDINQEKINKHELGTRGYFYLEDIAKRVIVAESLKNPTIFCLDKYANKLEIQPTNSKQTGSSIN